MTFTKGSKRFLRTFRRASKISEMENFAPWDSFYGSEWLRTWKAIAIEIKPAVSVIGWHRV
jgi:hypothetical protein